MKKWLFAFSMAGLLALTGCSRPAPEEETSPAETETVEEAPVEEETSGIKVIENVGPDKNRTVSLRIVDENNPALPGSTHLVHPGIQRFGPFPAMRIEPRYTVAESGFHVEEVTFVTQYGTHVDAPALRAALRGHRRRRRRALSGLGP